MKENYLKAFVESVKEVINEISKIKFEKGKVEIIDFTRPSYKISILITINGPISVKLRRG